MKISAGDPIKEGTIAHKAMVTKQKVSEFINRDIFGIPYLGTAVPFLYNENLEGCLVAIYPALTDGKSVVTLQNQSGLLELP